MIQFNLLPDVKLQYIRTQRRKRLVVTASFIVTSVCLVIFIMLLLFVRVAQTNQISDLSDDINEGIEKIESTKDLDKVLTIQNQLNSLPDLHDDKVISSRLFLYLTQLTPQQATLSNVEIDFVTNTIKLKGNTDLLSTVNKFADTLKFTEFSKKNDQGKDEMVKAFKGVVLSSFSVGSGITTTAPSSQEQVSYELSLEFDPLIFVNTKQADPPKLTIPKIITTRSETEKPAVLFVPQPEVEAPVQ